MRADGTQSITQHGLSPSAHESKPFDIVIYQAQGVYLWTTENKCLLDCASRLSGAILGHQHPYFEARYQHYAASLPRVSQRARTAIEAQAAKRLIASAKADRIESVFWASSEEEALRTAILAAQRFEGGKHLVVCLSDDAPDWGMSQTRFRLIHLPASHGLKSRLEALQREYPNQIGVVVVDGALHIGMDIQAEDFDLRRLGEWCHEKGLTVVCDERRTFPELHTDFFAFQRVGLRPELVVFGRSVGNGAPVAGVMGRTDMLDGLDTPTPTGNPHGCAAILAMFDTFEKCGIQHSCSRVGEILSAGLHELSAVVPFVAAVQGTGLAWTLKMKSYRGKTSDRIASDCVRACLEHGLYVDNFPTPSDLGIAPALTICEAELQDILARLRRAFEQISQATPEISAKKENSLSVQR